MARELVRSARRELADLGRQSLDWVGFCTEATRVISGVVPFQRSCWHTVDPGTVLFTGSLNQDVAGSGTWLAQHEFAIEDVNKWSFLASSGRRAGATSLATHGDLSRSARHRSHESYGIGDELRASLVVDGTYWGALALLRDLGDRWFTVEDVALLASLSEPLADGLRRSLLVSSVTTSELTDDDPGVVVFDEEGELESISSAAERWVGQLTEIPAPVSPAESKMVQAAAARARSLAAGQDPLLLAARARVQTRSGRWLLLYGTQLAGGPGGRTAVIIQPAPMAEVAPLVALAYGLSEREQQVAGLCLTGRSTKEIAQSLHVSPYTVQDHLKSIFDKTGVRSRGELVGQVFLEHYVPRWEQLASPPSGWRGFAAGELVEYADAASPPQ